MTDTLKRAEELLAGITPGEWRLRIHPHDATAYFVEADRLNIHHPYDIEILGEDDALYPTKRKDAEFVAAAPSLVRELIARDKEREAELTSLRGVVEKMREATISRFGAGSSFTRDILSLLPNVTK